MSQTLTPTLSHPAGGRESGSGATSAAPPLPRASVGESRGGGLASYLLVAPLALVFLLFFVAPMALVVVVSFFNYETYDILIPGFTLQNYIDVFTDSVTWVTYLKTLEFCVIVWAI